ncbi:MAG: hypothetical protein ACFFB3_22095, partial [Candidatus Hodarchaeota archaeon]
GKSYTLFCVSYPSSYEPHFVDRDALGAIFEEAVAPLEDLSMVTLELLTKIKKSIVNLKMPQS